MSEKGIIRHESGNAPAVASQATLTEQARAVAEVQAAVTVAQQVRRDQGRAEAEMKATCERLSVANKAFYSVPNRGTGPTVHLMRELARIWGNVQYGVHELRRDDSAGVSEVQAFAWDVQTNTRSTRTFQVPHQRMVKGERKPLVDLGDVYLNNQNVGARAVRECIFTILPPWFTEEAEEIARRTLRDGDGKPLSERVESMVTVIAERWGIKQSQLEAKIGRKRGQWDAGDVASMQVLYRSIERGEVTIDEEFEAAAPTFSKATKPEPSQAQPEAAATDPWPAEGGEQE